MKKRTLLVAMLAFAAIPSIGQKTNKLNCGRIAYEVPPEEMTLQGFSTYYITHENANTMSFNDQVNQYNLPDFTKAASQNVADFTIKFFIAPFSIETPKLSIKETTKDGKTTKSYIYTSKVTYRIGAILTTKNNTELVQLEYNNTASIIPTMSSGTNDSAKKDYEKTKTKVINDCVKLSVGSFIEIIKNRFCYVSKTKKFELVTVKPKKFEYENANKGAAYFTEVITLYNEGEKPTTDVLAKCEEAINFWTKDLTEADFENKNVRINRDIAAAFYFNIGMAYFAMEEYTKSVENLQKAYDIQKNVTNLHFSWIGEAQMMSERKMNRRQE